MLEKSEAGVAHSVFPRPVQLQPAKRREGIAEEQPEVVFNESPRHPAIKNFVFPKVDTDGGDGIVQSREYGGRSEEYVIVEFLEFGTAF